MNTGELVLHRFLDPAYAARAEEVFAALGMGSRPVSVDETAQSVGYLAGLPGHGSAPRPLVLPEFDESIMVLCGFSRARMDVLFDAMRGAGAPPPGRKAILTPTNMGWTLDALYEELGREHEAMHGQKKNR